MPTPTVPFPTIQAAAAAYVAALAEGYPPAYGGAGGRSALHRAGAVLGLRSQKTLRARLTLAAMLGLPVPGWPAADPRAAVHHRLRYRDEDAEYRAWLAGEGATEARRAARAGEVAAPPLPDAARPPAGMALHRQSAAYDGSGTLLRQWVGTKRDAGEAFAAPPGHMVRGVSALVDAENRVVQRWVKTREGALGQGLVEALQDAFAAFAGAAPIAPPPGDLAAELHTIYPLADLHLGAYAWGRETGESYDLSIAVDRARSAFRALVALAPPARSCTLLNLGDYFHANDEKAATPRSGHRLDVDGRWPKVLRAGADLMLELVDLLAQRHERVEVVTLPGNHDPDAAAALRVALHLYYRGRDRIEVDDQPGLIWYRRHGRCLFGATHGHTVKPERLAGMMAADRPEDWGAAHHRAFFLGHIHHERAREEAGVRIESFNTLASRDAYAHGGGWRAGHAVQAITFHAEAGEVTRHRVNVVLGRPRVRVPAASAA